MRRRCSGLGGRLSSGTRSPYHRRTAVDGPAQSVQHPPQQLGAYGHVHRPPHRLDAAARPDARAVAQGHHQDGLVLKAYHFRGNGRTAPHRINATQVAHRAQRTPAFDGEPHQARHHAYRRSVLHGGHRTQQSFARAPGAPEDRVKRHW